MSIENEIKGLPLPQHVALIMDGNGRWARKQGKKRTAGHKEGLTAAKRIVAKAAELGIKYVTLYTFSTENWKRAQEEVGYLMGLIKGHLRAEFQFYKDNGIRIEHLGDLEGLPADVQKEILNARKDTAKFTGTTCVLAINYGGKDEIVRGIRKIVSRNLPPEEVTEDLVKSSLDLPELPDVDLMIRTGGESRISNFLLWQAAYAEFIFTDTLWPDYTEEEFMKHIRDFQNRDRRFGGVKETENS